MKILFGLLYFMSIVFFAGAQGKLVSKVYPWEEVSVPELLSGTVQTLLKGSTTVFRELEVVTGALSGSGSSVLKKPGYEEMVIVKEGILDVNLNGIRTPVTEGGIVLVSPGDVFILTNGWNEPTFYYLFRWKTVSTPPSGKADPQSVVYPWEEMTFVPSEKGGRRNVLQRPTALLNELEIHTTSLKAGLPSHAAHTHSDDEFILVKTGMVEETVNGKPVKAGTGSLIFLSGTDHHGIRNAGEETCEYYAIRFK
ncbi:MAG TPA: cupin domain-containing protein [Prolixibacteraceae bacterium]|nr:cupin domain-containing protein [Prolixibacteraceae bacterium]